MRAARRMFVNELPERERLRLAGVLAERLRDHLPQGAIIAAYEPMPSEIDPQPAVPDPAYPWFENERAPMRFRRGWPLACGPFGIKQPEADAPLVHPTVILAPLLAASPDGTRLGQGGGHYDRYLAALPDRAAVMVIGVGWDFQLIDAVPRDPWDIALDAVATPARWIAVA